MKSFVLRLIASIAFTGIIVLSCKKEYSCEGCNDSNKFPFAMAGADQLISLPVNSIILNGTASYDPDGTIMAWRWTKIAGPSCQFNHADSAITKADQLMQGIYLFELQVTDDKGASAKDTVQLTVNVSADTNQPPIAIAGPDQYITLPMDSILLDGTASTDPDGQVTKWQWTKIAGPSSYNIQTFDLSKTVVKKLVQGNYQFELKVIDDKGASATDTINVVVMKNEYIDSLRVDSLYGNISCSILIANLDTRLPPGAKFDVYIRYYWGSNDNGSAQFFKLDTFPDAQALDQPMTAYWYWFEYSNGLLTIHYPHNIDCNFDANYHDVMIKWY